VPCSVRPSHAEHFPPQPVCHWGSAHDVPPILTKTLMADETRSRNVALIALSSRRSPRIEGPAGDLSGDPTRGVQPGGEGRTSRGAPGASPAAGADSRDYVGGMVDKGQRVAYRAASRCRCPQRRVKASDGRLSRIPHDEMTANTTAEVRRRYWLRRRREHGRRLFRDARTREIVHSGRLAYLRPSSGRASRRFAGGQDGSPGFVNSSPTIHLSSVK
jgi:hypothetical protein